MASAEGSKTAIEDGGTAKSEGDLTQAKALEEYAALKTTEDKKAYRVKNWRVLGCSEEKE